MAKKTRQTKDRTLLLRHSECLVFFFSGRKLHCKNYLTDIEVEAPPLLVPILARLNRWRTIRGIERLFPEYSHISVRRTLRELIQRTLVAVRGDSLARREAALRTWGHWGVEARFFHFASKNVHRAPLQIEEARFSRALKRRSPTPPSIKAYRKQPRIKLPDPKDLVRGEFPEILLKRRSHRHFGNGKVSLEQLSVVLRLTWGFTDYVRWPGLGRLPVKTSPSGGARHSLEVYLWCSRVEGLTRGVYHYRPDRHHLELLKVGPVANRMAVLCGYQPWVRRCSVLFVMTSMLGRVMWRYRFSRAYRVILLEAGHFCQTFCLAATWLGLASFCTAALYDEKIERELGLKADEAVIYAAGFGKPAHQ